MKEINTKELVKNLINIFLSAGKISIDLRKKGLTKKIKSDNTPVSNGDLEVNEIIIKKLKELTQEQPINAESMAKIISVLKISDEDKKKIVDFFADHQNRESLSSNLLKFLNRKQKK